MILKHGALALLAMAAALAAQDPNARVREKLATTRLNADFEDAPLPTVAEVHARIDRVLSAMRYLANFTVTCEARVVDLAPGALPGAPTLGSLTAGKVILSREEAAALLAAPGKSVQVQEALRFTCANGQRMHVALSRTREEVQGLLSRWSDTVVQANAARTVLEVLPILAVGREEVLVDLNARLADPPAEPQTIETPFGDFQLARSAARLVRTTLAVPNGGGALLALGVSGDRVRALFLRVTSNAQPLTVTPAPVEEVPTDDDAALGAWNRFREMPISVDLDNVKLAEFVRRIQDSGEINCVIDPVLVEEGTTEQTVLLRVNEIPGEVLVRLVTQMLGIGYAFRDEALLFTRPDRTEESVVQVYDVRDLLTAKRDYPGPALGPVEEGGALLGEDADSSSECFVEELVDAVRRNIEPSSWEEYSDRTGILMVSGALYILQFPSVHEKIRKLLEDFRASRPRQVQVDARVIDLDASVHDGLDAGSGGALPDASRAAIERALAAGQGRAEAIWSILGLNGQRFHAAMFGAREYVDDWDADEKTGEPDPVYKRLSTGYALDVRPTLPSAEDGSVSVEVHAQCCDAPETLPSVWAGKLLVQTPATGLATLHTTVLPEAGRAYLFTLGASAADRRRVLLLTVREAK